MNAKEQIRAVDELQYRTLPHNVDAERGLLGAILVDNRAYEAVSEFLLPVHFSLPGHAIIFDAISRVIEKGQLADPISLKQVFDREETLADVGGAGYLAELAASAVTVINAAEYGRVMFDLHLKREVISIGQDMVNGAFASDVERTGLDQIEDAEQSLYNLATTGEYGDSCLDFKTALVSAVDMAERAHKRDGGLAGVTSGLIDIDELLGGLHPSDLLILAGRPAMGKTALATNIAFACAEKYVSAHGEEGAPVGFFSLEMSAEQLASRILSEQSEISSDRMRKGQLQNDEFARVVTTSQTLHSLPLFIDDTASLTVSSLRTRARRMKRQHGIGLIVIDYLQLMQGTASAKSDGRVQEVSEITRGLKILAKELNVPVIALSQLSRKVEDREDKRPQLADLRESGSIEQDADVVSFIYREEYYMAKAEPRHRAEESADKYAMRMVSWEERLAACANVAEFIVAKQRHGPVGTVKLAFQGEFTRFSNYTNQPDDGGRGFL